MHTVLTIFKTMSPCHDDGGINAIIFMARPYGLKSCYTFISKMFVFIKSGKEVAIEEDSKWKLISFPTIGMWGMSKIKIEKLKKSKIETLKKSVKYIES